MSGKTTNPYFWWDYTKDTGAIVVESSHPKYPVLAMFDIGEDASPQIEMAQKLISDLRAGRVTLKQAHSDMAKKKREDIKCNRLGN